MEASTNTAEARSSFSPWRLLIRLVSKSQINSGMLKIRVIVMEFGKFTAQLACPRTGQK